MPNIRSCNWHTCQLPPSLGFYCEVHRLQRYRERKALLDQAYGHRTTGDVNILRCGACSYLEVHSEPIAIKQLSCPFCGVGLSHVGHRAVKEDVHIRGA